MSLRTAFDRPLKFGDREQIAVLRNMNGAGLYCGRCYAYCDHEEGLSAGDCCPCCHEGTLIRGDANPSKA